MIYLKLSLYFLNYLVRTYIEGCKKQVHENPIQ